MATRPNLRPNKSFRDNARILVPFLFEEFLSHRNRVVAHPKLKNDFHKMRIAGKRSATRWKFSMLGSMKSSMDVSER